jgi:hypothetical protein
MSDLPDLVPQGSIPQVLAKIERDISRLGPSCDNLNYSVTTLTLGEAVLLLTALRSLASQQAEQTESDK